MNSVELADKREQLKAEASSLLDGAQKEARKLTEEEQTHYDGLVEAIKATEEEQRNLEAKLEKRKIESVNINKPTNMQKKEFRLIKAINDIANNRGLDEAAQEVVSRGMAAMSHSGQSYSGQIVMPVESRAVDGVITGGNKGDSTHTGGKENVATNVLDILEPLRANMVLSQAGATYMTGLVGNVQIPVYSGSNVAWKGETATAANGVGAFSEVTLTPKRLTAYVDVSKQFLIQDSNSAEEMLRRDLINAISEKIEQTVFGAAAASTTQPGGLFNGVTADTTDVTWADIVGMETGLEANNVYGNLAYIVSPSAKATLKSTTISGSKSDLRLIMDGNTIDGLPVYTSSAVSAKGIVLGNFSDFVVAQWGAIDITVDPYTQAANGTVRLVVNAYFDAKARRAEAFSAKILK